MRFRDVEVKSWGKSTSLTGEKEHAGSMIYFFNFVIKHYLVHNAHANSYFDTCA